MSVMDIGGVLARLPHRFPMLLVDRVEELVEGEKIVAVKAVTFNEPFFQGHFPGRPIMPGVLIVEALAQAAGILAVETMGLAGSGKLVYFMAIDSAKFRKPVEPGVLLRLEAEFVQKRASVFNCVCSVVARVCRLVILPWISVPAVLPAALSVTTRSMSTITITGGESCCATAGTAAVPSARAAVAIFRKLVIRIGFLR